MADEARATALENLAVDLKKEMSGAKRSIPILGRLRALTRRLH
jgi:hypothetical protein